MAGSTFAVFTAFKAKDGVSGTFKNMTSHAGKFGTKVESSMGKAKAAMIGFKSAAKAVIGTTTALAAAAVGLMIPFNNWEKGIMSIYTLMKKDDIDKFGDKIKKLSKEAIKMGFSIEDTNKGLFDTVSALGVSEKSLDLYRQAMILAKGGCTDLAIAIDGMTSLTNAYGKETTDAKHIAEAFYTAQQYGKTTVGELASNVGKIAPIARSAGVGVNELLAAMSALTLGGLRTDEATTALRGALSALIKPSKEAEETLQALGVPYGMLQIRQKGLRYTLDRLNEAQKKHPELMASAIPNIKAFTAVMALSGDKLETMDNIMNDINHNMTSGNGLMAAFKNMGKTGSATMSKVTGEMTAACIQLGEVLAPYLLPIVRAFAMMVSELGKLAPLIAPVIDSFVSLGKAIYGVYKYIKDHFVPITIIASGILGAMLAANIHAVTWGLISFGIEAANTVRVLVIQRAAAIANTVAWNILGLALDAAKLKMILLGGVWGIVIAGLVLGVIWLIKNWDKVKEVAAKVIDSIKQGWNNFWQDWKIGVNIIKDYFVEKITTLWTNVKIVFTTIGSFIKEHFVDILLGALGPVGMIIQAIRKMPQILSALGFKSNAFKVKTNGSKDGTANIKGNSKGSIDVDVQLTNKTDINATVSTNLKSPHNMQLNPA